MSLGPGSRLGPYEIQSALGTGGMGEVYRATDTTLGRQVAIKVLPEAFAGNAERLARFEREAKTLAALNHPNIAQIYGVDRSGESPALVLELVEGDTLADQIARGPIPLDEALPIVKQIAEALEVAHAHGVIHRDLKPANIKLRPDGTVKVLDFGLAKLHDPNVSNVPNGPNALSMSPTITSPAVMTGIGVILGTAAYMSPEQAKGREADKRSDVWALGCVFYEMLTGRRPFDGEDVSDTLANVLKIDPDWTKLPSDLRSTLVALIKGCLEKNRAQRISDVAVVRFLLNQPAVAATLGAAAAPPSAVSHLHSRLGWAIAALAIVALAAVSWVHLREQPAVGPVVHLTVPLLEEVPPTFLALSPDGRTLVTTQPGTALRLYSLDSGEARSLTGTLAGRTPFWSPDSRTIAFFAEGMLKTVPASGGPPQRLCGDTGVGGGGTWSRSGVILFATDSGALRRVAAGGGECTDVVRVPGEQRARLPVFLPDGDHFLYSRREGIGRPEVYVASLEEPNGRRLLTDFSSAEFVPDRPGSITGYLLFLREQTLMAQRFDAASLELSGEPSAIAAQVGATATPPQIAASASTNGTIVYLANGRPDRQLVWYDHSGREISRGAGVGTGASAASLAPNGRWLTYIRVDAQFVTEARLVDLERQQETRLFAPPFTSPVVWSPDAPRLAFRNIVMGTAGLYLRNLNGGSEELLLREGNNIRYPSDWTRDNRWILYTEITEQTRGDIWMVPGPGRGPDAKPVPLLQTPAMESQGQVSPDGRWIAYSSDETGSDQVYIRPFVERDLSREPAWPVPTSGGREPRWRADGKELFYLVRVPGTSRVKLMSVSVGATENPLGEAKALFEIPVGLSVPQNNNWIHVPSPDGQRFAFVALAGDARPSLDVLLNWAANQRR